MSKSDDDWIKTGIRFECQGSGNCCVSRGEYGFVYMTRKDRVRAARSLDISTTDFTKTYCSKTDGIYHLNESDSDDCLFLKKNKCSIYKGRPSQCRSWPFWPEVMNAKTWKGEVAKFCPGVGKGRKWTPEEIQEIVAEQERSESQLGS